MPSSPSAIPSAYDFLERDLGVRFWSWRATDYPAPRATLSVEVDRRDAPVFALRDTDYWTTIRDKPFTATTRLNGDFGQQSSE